MVLWHYVIAIFPVVLKCVLKISTGN